MLYVEPEFYDVALAHDVVLAFHAGFAGGTGGGDGTQCDEVVVRDDFGFDEAFLEIGVDDASGLGGRPALVDGPSAGLLGTGGEEALQAESGVPDSCQFVQTRLVNTHFVEELTGLVLIHFVEFSFVLGVEEDGFGGGDESPQYIELCIVLEFVLVAVEDVDEGFGGQQEQIVQGFEVESRGKDSLALVEYVVRLTPRGQLWPGFLLGPGLLFHAGHGLLDGLEVGEDEFGGDGFDIGGGVDCPVDMRHILVCEHPCHLADCIGFADVGEESVAHSLTFGSTLDDAGDIYEADGGGYDPLGVIEVRQDLQPRIRYPHDAHIGLDGRERIVGREDVVARERIEKGGLARVGESDDTDSECHAESLFHRGASWRGRDSCARSKISIMAMKNDDILIELAAIVSNGNEGVVRDVTQLVRDPAGFVEAHQDWYESEFADSADDDNADFTDVFTYWLVESHVGALISRDTEPGTIRKKLSEMETTLGYPLYISQLDFTGEEEIDELLDLIGTDLESEGFGLYRMDIDADSSLLLIVRDEDEDAFTRDIAELGIEGHRH